MVVSKRCKICAVLNANNVSISGEYCGKLIPDLILRISGTELDKHKASCALICEFCIVQLVHTDLVIEKIRNAVQRLQKNVKKSKPKTPSKNSAQTVTKKELISESDDQKQDKTCESDPHSCGYEANTRNYENMKTPKQVARRKSVLLYDSNIEPVDDNNMDVGTGITVNKKKFQKLINDATPINRTVAKTSKRKQALSTTDAASKVSLHDVNDVDTIPIKRNKSTSVPVDLACLMDLIDDEQNGNVSNNEINIKEIKAKEVNCIVCGNIFYSKTTLRDHVESEHEGEQLKACPHCSSEFRSKQKYDLHVFREKCKSTYIACQYPNCNKRFKNARKMQIHMNEKHSS